MNRIYLSPPHVSLEERQLLMDAFDSNWIAPLGPHVDAFEREFADLICVPHAAALSSGTAALHLGLLLLGVGQDDEVLTSTLTFAATANAIVYRGAKPVFIDSSADTWTMDPDLLEEELEACAERGRMPKAVLVVDLYGQCADYDRLLSICERFDVPLIEDAAEALGSTYRDRPAGSFGVMAAFSFNGNKIITTSGGGMLVSHRSDWIDRARYLSTQARENTPHYQHSEVGYNYRLSNLLAAVGRGQLRNLQDRVRRRRAHNAFYRQAFAGVAGISFMPEASYGVSNNWLTCIVVDQAAFGCSTDEIRRHLLDLQIESRPVWKPLHLQPAFSNCRSRGGSVSQDLFERGLCLPSGSSMTAAERTRVVESVLSTPRRGYAAARIPTPLRQAVQTPAEEPVARFVQLKQLVLKHGRAVSVAVQLSLVCFSNAVAFWLRFDNDVPPWAQAAFWSMLPWLVTVRTAAFIPLGVFGGLWRYSSLYDLRRIVEAVCVSTLALFVLVHTPLGPPTYPRSVYIVDSLLLIVLLGGLRGARRLYAELHRTSHERRVLVVGAGSAGELVVRDMMKDPSKGLRAVGFVDDDAGKRGLSIHGVPVLGTRAELPKIVDQHRPDDVFIALPSASPATLRAIVRDFEPYHLNLRTLPALRDLSNHQVGVAQLRQMRVEDLVPRAVRSFDEASIRKLIEGQTILITGAGGAIGSEIARQLAYFGAGQVVLLDRAERGLQEIAADLKARGVAFTAVVGTVADASLVDETITRWRPRVIFHAAAQNQSPLMALDPCEAVRSNLLGCHAVARAAIRHRVERFILVSTLKAVNPLNTGSATRRAAEIVVEALSGGSQTILSSIRVGNLVGRPGSFIEIMKDQIQKGGPVVVADPELRRYLVLAKDAARFVILAAVLAENGTNFVVDMGEQRRLLDVARELIRLEGLVPEQDIAVHFSGLGDNERLYDELAGPHETVSPSKADKLLRVRSTVSPDAQDVLELVETMQTALIDRDDDAILAALRTMVAEYTAGSPAAIAPVGAPAGGAEPTAPARPHGYLDGTSTQKCPRCTAPAAHRSHTRWAGERIRKSLTTRRLYRCEACGWRGWLIPVHYETQASVEPAPLPDLTSLDTMFRDRESRPANTFSFDDPK